MLDLHCQRCGGRVANPAGTTYREASTATPLVPPPTSACVCGHPASLWELLPTCRT